MPSSLLFLTNVTISCHTTSQPYTNPLLTRPYASRVIRYSTLLLVICPARIYCIHHAHHLALFPCNSMESSTMRLAKKMGLVKKISISGLFEGNTFHFPYPPPHPPHTKLWSFPGFPLPFHRHGWVRACLTTLKHAPERIFLPFQEKSTTMPLMRIAGLFLWADIFYMITALLPPWALFPPPSTVQATLYLLYFHFSISSLSILFTCHYIFPSSFSVSHLFPYHPSARAAPTGFSRYHCTTFRSSP